MQQQLRQPQGATSARTHTLNGHIRPAGRLSPSRTRPCQHNPTPERRSSSRCHAQQQNNDSSSSSSWRSGLFSKTATTTTATPQRTPTSSSSGSPLGSVLGSVDEAEQQWQQAGAFQQAYLDGSLGFGFSAGGLLFPYYLGVAEQLQELGILQDSSQLAGASAGSLIVACIKSGLPFDTIKEACFELARNCRDKGTRHRLRHVLECTLQQVLPDDVADICSGGIHVAITRITPGLKPTLVSSFKDRDDLIQALLTSCHIPWYFDGSLVRSYRQTPCFDGGITNFLPNVPGSSTTCRVCCLPRQQLAAIRNIAISPDAFEPWPYNVQQMVNWALEPADEDMLKELIQFGRRDALKWAQQTGLAALASLSSSSGSSLDGSISSSSIDGSVYSPLSSSDGVWLPPAAAAAAGSNGSSNGAGVSPRGEDAPVGTSLFGLVKTLVSHSSNSSKKR